MPIVVYWLHEGRAAHEEFGDHELSGALSLAELRRREGCRHVSISSELEASVGKPGVNAVENGKLPSGDGYGWSKQHRGAGPRKD